MKKKKATGRPRKKYGRKSRLMTVKTTPEQRALYDKAADACRTDLSDWVRTVLDAEAKRVLSDPMARPTEDTWEP